MLSSNNSKEVPTMSPIRKLSGWTAFALSIFLAAAPLASQAETPDEIHKKALKEGGTLNFYGTLAQINAEKILPVFEKRFPGIKINPVDATSDRGGARV